MALKMWKVYSILVWNAAHMNETTLEAKPYMGGWYENGCVMGMEWIQLNTDVENICLPSSGMVDRYKLLGGTWCLHHLCTWGIHMGIDGNWYREGRQALEQCFNWEFVSEDGGSSFIQNAGTFQTKWCHLLIVTTVRVSHLTKQVHLELHGYTVHQ